MIMNTRSKNKAVLVMDSSDEEADIRTSCSVTLDPLFPELINLGETGGKFPPGSKSTVSHL